LGVKHGFFPKLRLRFGLVVFCFNSFILLPRFSQPAEILLAIVSFCVYYPADLMRWSISAARPFQPLGHSASASRSETEILPETSLEFTCLKQREKNSLRSFFSKDYKNYSSHPVSGAASLV
jgi:hypothetical protein